MIDTLKARCSIDNRKYDMNYSAFTGRSMAQDMHKERVVGEKARWYTKSYERMVVPRVTWMPETKLKELHDEDIGFLDIEVSIPKMLDAPSVILSEKEVDRAIDYMSEYLEHLNIIGLSPVREWKCIRLDTCYAWETAGLTRAYIAALGTMSLPTYIRTPFETEGVLWRNASRWVKFYDKTREQKLKDYGILRFEVSNLKDACSYMATRKYDIPQTIHAMTRREFVYDVLVEWLGKVGVRGQSFGHDDVLLSRLKRDFGGVRTGTAYVFMQFYERYGNELYKPESEGGFGLLTKSTYYNYLKELKLKGYLPVSDQTLPPLDLPDRETFGLESIGTEWQ